MILFGKKAKNRSTETEEQKAARKQAEKEALDPDADYTEDNGNFEIPPEDDSDEDTSEEQDVTPI